MRHRSPWGVGCGSAAGCSGIVAGLALVLLLGAADAAEPEPPSVEARLERLERQNERLAAENEQLQRRLDAVLDGPAGRDNDWPAASAGGAARAPGAWGGRQIAQPVGIPDPAANATAYLGDASASALVAPAGAGPLATQQALTQPQVEKVVADYLSAHPGAGMPYGVQTGYTYGKGFTIRSVGNPEYDNWWDEMKNPPFELRIRGRLQLDFYNFHITDFQNYQTGQTIGPTGGLERRADLDVLEVKRMRLIFEGMAFDPDSEVSHPAQRRHAGTGRTFQQQPDDRRLAGERGSRGDRRRRRVDRQRGSPLRRLGLLRFPPRGLPRLRRIHAHADRHRRQDETLVRPGRVPRQRRGPVRRILHGRVVLQPGRR